MTIEQAVESLREDIVHSVCDLVCLGSVHSAQEPGKPFGADIDRCYRRALAIARSLGFATQDFDGYAGHAELGEGGNVIGILGHLDVVPAGNGWTYPPFGATLENGRIYGRGTMDDKGPLVAAMYAVKAVQIAGVPLTKRIRVIFGLDEERDWKCMKHYLSRVTAPDVSFTPDSSFPLIYAEKGICQFVLSAAVSGEGPVRVLRIEGGKSANVVPDRCEALLVGRQDLAGAVERHRWQTGDRLEAEKCGDGYRVRAFGASAHGAAPNEGTNAIAVLLRLLDTLELGGPVAGAVQFYRDHLADTTGGGLGCALTDDIAGALTVNVGAVRFDGEHLEFTVDVRYPVHSTVDEVYGRIRTCLAGSGFALRHLSGKAPHFVDPHSDFVEQLAAAYAAVTGDTDSSPRTTGGGTYARAVPCAVGFGPQFPGGAEVAHRENEWIAVEDLILCAKIYAQALCNLMKLDL